MSRAADRIAAIAKAARDAAIDKGVKAIGEQLPGVEVRATDDGIELKGRGLIQRLAREPVLRWIGKLFR